MTVHHARVITLAAVLVGISAIVLLGACAGAPATLDEQRALAEQGDVEMQVRLGGFYEFGNNGVPEDDVEAVRWFRLAAEQGHAEGQYRLGRMYQTGQGVAEDSAEAARWDRLAGEQGHASRKGRRARRRGRLP